jgi:hypothetical protein
MLGMQRDVLRDLFSVFTTAELQQLEALVGTMVERLSTRDGTTIDTATTSTPT